MIGHYLKLSPATDDDDKRKETMEEAAERLLGGLGKM